MTQRGQVVLLDFPFTSGTQSKIRPALVVQNDRDNQRLTKTIVAMITGNLRRASEATHCPVDPGTPEGASSGLRGQSVVVCVNLYTIDQSDILRTLGSLSPRIMRQIDACLKAALELP